MIKRIKIDFRKKSEHIIINLFIGGVLNSVIALLHFLIIIGGPQWYRFFGAGEGMAQLAETGSVYPALITSALIFGFLTCAIYGFSGAGILGRFPRTKAALTIILTVYLFRGFFGIPLVLYLNSPYFNELEDKMGFMIISSIISVFIGLLYLKGTIQFSRSNKSGLPQQGIKKF